MQHSSIYVKALPLQELDDVETIKGEVRMGNILIVRITPLARKSVEETKLAITELTDYTKSLGGDIARLGEERIVITPAGMGEPARNGMMGSHPMTQATGMGSPRALYLRKC